MISARSASVNRAQAATSARVRWHPKQRPLSPSTTQILTQGVAIARAAVSMERRWRMRVGDASVTFFVTQNYIEVRSLYEYMLLTHYSALIIIHGLDLTWA